MPARSRVIGQNSTQSPPIGAPLEQVLGIGKLDWIKRNDSNKSLAFLTPFFPSQRSSSPYIHRRNLEKSNKFLNFIELLITDHVVQNGLGTKIAYNYVYDYNSVASFLETSYTQWNEVYLIIFVAIFVSPNSFLQLPFWA